MRRITCDQYEFDPPDSEQAVELAVASPSHHCPDLPSLLATCGASGCIGTPPPPGWFRWSVVAEHLRRFAGLDLPRPERCRSIVLLSDETDEIEVGIEFGSAIVWYYCATTA